MISHYLTVDKSGLIGQLRRVPVEGIIHGNSKKVRTYSRHGHEDGRVVQITCDEDVESNLLRLMRHANIRQLDQKYDMFTLLTEKTAIGTDMYKISTAHIEAITGQGT